MPEYIDREKLLEDIEHTVIFTVRKSEFAYGESRGAIKVINRIEAAPSADVVEVVRCKECEYAKEHKNNLFCCYYPTTPKSISSYDFCSYGIRKDGDKNEN